VNQTELLADLNEAQRQAVTTLEGPLLIVAGAGTGKTRVIAHRIAYLLDHVPGLTPDQLLALTFSKRAAEEMRERVESLLGRHADSLPVSTFHAFCHQILHDHHAEAGLPARLQLLDRVEQWILLRRLLPELALTTYASRTDPASCLDGLVRCINRAKDELVSPADYATYAEQVTDPAARSGVLEVARVYARYQSALQAAGAVDFGDLIMETLRLFRERPALLVHYQAQFRYLLVDEFQDTNVAQITLLAALAAPHRNLCVVGDDDQAIYRFRGASYASFVLFQEQFPEATAIRLTQNYRSRPHILRVAERLIQGNGEDRFDPTKQLLPTRTSGTPVDVVVCRDDAQQATVVVDRIRAVISAMPPSERAYRRIAVLYRAHAHREVLVEALQREGIPHLVAGGAALFEEEVIRDLMACLRVVEDPMDSISLFRLLGLPLWGLELSDVVQATRAAKQQQRPLYQILRAPKVVTWRPGVRSRVTRCLAAISRWQRVVHRQGVEALARCLLEEVGYRPRLAAGDAESRAAVTALSRWHRFVQRALETHGRPNDLAAFLWYLEAYQEAGGEPTEELSTTDTDGVQLMTIHQAKGLEFDWVFLLSLVQGRFPSRARAETVPFPVELMKERLPSGDVHLQEERRLCYVAMTRAREGLTLMTVERPYQRPSVFIRELWDRPELGDDLLRTELPLPEPMEQARAVMDQAAVASIQQIRELFAIVQELQQCETADDAAVDETLARLMVAAKALVGPRAPATPVIPPPTELKVSFTQLETYRFCPQKYQYAYIYQIPIRPTSRMQFGTNLHACLEAFAERLMAGQTPTVEELLALFEETWRSEGYPDPVVEAKDRAYGRGLLTQYYEVNRASLRPPLFIEKPFLLKVGDVGVRGFIDRIDAQPDGRVEVVDYKAGKPKTAAEVGDRLQLNIYALACRDVLKLTPAAMSFYYLQTNAKLSFPYDEAGARQAEQTITETAQKIRAGMFEPTPALGKCRVCDFRTICPASAA